MKDEEKITKSESILRRIEELRKEISKLKEFKEKLQFCEINSSVKPIIRKHITYHFSLIRYKHIENEIEIPFNMGIEIEAICIARINDLEKELYAILGLKEPKK